MALEPMGKEPQITSFKRVLVMLTGLGSSPACQDSPAGPESDYGAADGTSPAITPVPSLVTFNSASCTLTSASTGAVSCSWDISNPAQTSLNLWTEALLQASYDCVNPKNGRIASSEVREIWTARPESGISSPSITGSNVALPLPALVNDYQGSMKKLNACRGNTVVQNLAWSLEYWDVAVAAIGGTLRESCFGSDNRYGCFTP